MNLLANFNILIPGNFELILTFEHNKYLMMQFVRTKTIQIKTISAVQQSAMFENKNEIC